jgi:phage pi2 protein 07
MQCCFIPDDKLTMNKNGNLELNNRGYIMWQTSTRGEGNFAALEDNGGLVVYDKDHKKLWSSLDIPFDTSKSKFNVFFTINIEF